MKLQYPLLITLGLVLLVIAFVKEISIVPSGSFEEDKRTVIIRKIGHEILLNAGDSASRVLPVQELDSDQFQLRFENNFSFEPDSIVKIIDRAIITNEIEQDYIVNILECSNDKIIYGYAIIASQQNEIVPCSGRRQQEKCYYVNIRFDSTSMGILHTKTFRIGIATLGLFFLVFGISKNRSTSKNEEGAEIRTGGIDNKIELGRFVFDPSENLLILNDDKTKLTAKESKLLFVFASRPNQVIDREELQQKVWGDEGIVVGRSLDIFISKLRKKLTRDPNVTLLNIFGKGYKLVIVP